MKITLYTLYVYLCNETKGKSWGHSLPLLKPWINEAKGQILYKIVLAVACDSATGFRIHMASFWHVRIRVSFKERVSASVH